MDDLWSQVEAVSQLEGTFKLRSGLVSNTYFDKYQFETRPEVMAKILDELVKLIPEETEILAGLELGGVPIAMGLSLRTGLPCAFVRKKAKDYGTRRLAEGPEISGRKLCVIEDVVTTGGQIRTSVGELRELGAVIDTAICVIHRDSGQGNPLADAGLNLIALFSPRVDAPSVG